MSNYEDLPCSIYQSRQPVEPQPNHHLPRVVEDLPLQKPVGEAAVTEKKKSCLTSANVRKETPVHPALRRKTVAFGRTVNVSQTVEGTSRLARKTSASSSATSSPAQKMNENASAEGQEWRKVMEEAIETKAKVVQEETIRRLEELNNKNMSTMQDMMSQIMQKLTVAQRAMEGKAKRQERLSKLSSKAAIARQKIKKEGVLPPEAIPFLERRIQTDPIFRQQIDDVLADAEYDENGGRYSPISDGYTRAEGGKQPTLRETVTVERSIQYPNGLSSIDSRQWTKERDNRSVSWKGGFDDVEEVSGEGRWRTYDAGPLHSTYQPGNSLSYYPSAAPMDNANNRGRDGYYVEHLSDQEDDVYEEEYQDRRKETAAERERRIREKYARKK
ncbi:unnamed protein product [Caenorhabditis sp. 36 PRJEB53466]|nr:unnamed protein product [Caenorhabditis sp. 36 PRJEB53466]